MSFPPIEPVAMLQDLRTVQANTGAHFDDTEFQVPLQFTQDTEALKLAHTGVVLYDRSHWGLIQVSDDDRLRYLHNQSTNDFYTRKPGEGCDTVFVTSTARTIDLVTAYLLEDAVWLLTSPNRRQPLIQWLDRYIFPADRVKVTDLTGSQAIFNLIGPDSENLLIKLGADPLPGQPDGTHHVTTIAEIPVRLAVGTGVAISGYTLLVAAEQAAQLWQHLQTAGAMPLGETSWNQLRIAQGRPMPDTELTDDCNPLEAGLWHTISFNKGCYIGQETIARLNTYQGVKQRLWCIQLSQFAEVGSLILVEEDRVGKLTSVSLTDSGPIGLAYVRTKAGGPGLKVRVLPAKDHSEATSSPEIEGVIHTAPFLTHPD